MTHNHPQPMNTPLPLNSLSRRAMIGRLGGSLGAVGVASALAADQSLSHYGGRAKRVIQLFMNGGPYQGDLFDPKPALKKFQGQRPEGATLRTERITGGLLPSIRKFAPRGNSGVIVSDLLPEISRVIDDICVLKGCYSDNPNHNPAMFLMNCGALTSAVPSVGSWVSYGLGSENRNLPAFVVLATGYPVEAPLTWTSAFLPGIYQGNYILTEKREKELIPNLTPKQITPDQQLAQVALTQFLNRKHRGQRPGDDRLENRIHSMELAFRMQTAATDVFDLSQEPQYIRDMYGDTTQGRNMLMARRLVERGVRYVQCFHGDRQPWDSHNSLVPRLTQLCKDSDQPIAALLTDLKQRGLLDDTLVIWGGEMGRTPTVQTGSTNINRVGRDHHVDGYTIWMAGGGFRGGMTYGRTDDLAMRVEENPVLLHDLHATILHQMGFDHERLTYHYAGRDYRLTDVHGKVIMELLS